MQSIRYILSYFAPAPVTPTATPKPPSLIEGPELRKKNKNKKRNDKKKEKKNRGPLSMNDIILYSMRYQPVKVWGFVLVRCTYKDEARWKSFLEELESATITSLENCRESPESMLFLKESLEFTTIEDEQKLGGATMNNARALFQEWSVGEGAIAQQGRYNHSPRWEYFIYVNEESIESILNPIRAKESTGNFLLLASVRPESRDEEDDGRDFPSHIEDEVDESFKMISAGSMPSQYVFYAEDPNFWYGEYAWPAPPNFGGMSSNWNWWKEILKEDNGGAIGLDVYKMLKQIYGEGDYRNKGF